MRTKSRLQTFALLSTCCVMGLMVSTPSQADWLPKGYQQAGEQQKEKNTVQAQEYTAPQSYEQQPASAASAPAPVVTAPARQVESTRVSVTAPQKSMPQQSMMESNNVFEPRLTTPRDVGQSEAMVVAQATTNNNAYPYTTQAAASDDVPRIKVITDGSAAANKLTEGQLQSAARSQVPASAQGADIRVQSVSEVNTAPAPSAYVTTTPQSAQPSSTAPAATQNPYKLDTQTNSTPNPAVVEAITETDTAPMKPAEGRSIFDADPTPWQPLADTNAATSSDTDQYVPGEYSSSVISTRRDAVYADPNIANGNIISLKDAMSQGLYTNPEYGVVANNRRATDEELRQARGLYLPSLDLNADTGWEHSDDPGTRGGVDDDPENLWRYDAGLTLTQMLFDGFETKYENRRQKARVLSASHRVRETAELVGLDIVQSYLNVMRQRELLNIAKMNVAEHVRILDQITDSSLAGRSTTADQDQAKARLASAKANFSSVQEDLRVAEAAYIQEVGRSPENLTLPLVPYDALLATVEDQVKYTLDESPTLKIFEADMDVAAAEHDGSKSLFYPQLDLVVNAREGKDIAGIRGRDTSASALAVVNWNLYRGGIDSARVRELMNRHATVKEQRADAARGLENDVRQTWAGMEFAVERASQFAIKVASDTQVVSAYMDQFDLSRRTLLDVLDAQNELFVSRSNQVNAEFVEMFAVYRLLALKGDLLAMFDVEPPREFVPEKL